MVTHITADQQERFDMNIFQLFDEYKSLKALPSFPYKHQCFYLNDGQLY